MLDIDSESDVMYSCIDSDCLDVPDIDEFDVLPAVLLGVRGILVLGTLGYPRYSLFS
jgi:hypothetical protein